ncbi:hypothetical protein [Inediibacterium massiliense]|uniref:hypothetical protein n=1 Tax=Inediibacterium massiliense TaxID=1658111 RepID=UPI0006B48BB4|nr:hypothetical protein [Inediibacterium massiliense]
MAKKLITKNNVNQYVCENKIYLDKDMLLSPGVKDILRDKNIMIIYEQKKERIDMKNSISHILLEDYHVKDDKTRDAILQKVLDKINNEKGEQNEY